MSGQWRLRTWARAATIVLALSGLAGAAVGQTAPTTASPPSGITPPSVETVIQDLVDASHILFAQGVLDGFGHISGRHPTNPQRFFISRARAPSEVTAEDMIEFDLDGKPVGGPGLGKPIFREVFIHSEVYRARADVKGVVHSHSPAVVPFTVVDVPLRPVAQTVSFLCGGIPNFDIADTFGATNILVTSAERGKALADKLGQRPVALMRGHGNTVVGSSVRRAAYQAVFVEIAAKLQTQALLLSGGKPVKYLSDGECQLRIDEIKREDANPAGAEGIDRNWETWKRQIGRGR